MNFKSKLILVLCIATIALASAMTSIFFQRPLTTEVKVRGLDCLISEARNGDAYRDQIQVFELTNTSDVNVKNIWVSLPNYYETDILKVSFSLSASYNGTDVTGVECTTSGRYGVIAFSIPGNCWTFFDLGSEAVPINFYGESSLETAKMRWVYYACAAGAPNPTVMNVLEISFTFSTVNVDTALNDAMLDLVVTINLGI